MESEPEMAVNKNFVVKNLEVASNVILADATTKNVGSFNSTKFHFMKLVVELRATGDM